MLSPWIHIHFLVHFLCSSQSGLLIVYMLPFICLPFFERLLMPAFLLDVCSALSSLLLSPLLAVTDHHWLPKAFSDTLSDLPLPDHPKLSPLNSYRPLQLLCRSYQVWSIYTVVFTSSHKNRSSPRNILFFPSMCNIVLTHSWYSGNILLDCPVKWHSRELSRKLHPTKNIKNCFMSSSLFFFWLTNKSSVVLWCCMMYPLILKCQSPGEWRMRKYQDVKTGNISRDSV